MQRARFSWRRLGPALALGLLLEGLLLTAVIAAVNVLPDAVGEPIGDVLQAPGSYLVAWLGNVQHPGFEEQVAYVLFIPLIQWGFYFLLIYVWLSKRATRRALRQEAPARARCSR